MGDDKSKSGGSDRTLCDCSEKFKVTPVATVAKDVEAHLKKR